DRVIEALPQREQARRRGSVANHGWTVADRAGVGRAELEAAEFGVGGDRVDELAADDLGPGDARLGGAQVLLEQRDAVHRRLEFGRIYIGVEVLVALEQPDAEPLAALVVLADERG